MPAIGCMPTTRRASSACLPHFSARDDVEENQRDGVEMPPWPGLTPPRGVLGRPSTEYARAVLPVASGPVALPVVLAPGTWVVSGVDFGFPLSGLTAYFVWALPGVGAFCPQAGAVEIRAVAAKLAKRVFFTVTSP